MWQLIIFLLLEIASCTPQDFPRNFKFGAATAAFQIEGAWDTDGKGESIWDRYMHNKNVSYSRVGDIAGDSYHLWREDIRLAKQLGLDFYRFSLSWPRILPSGLYNNISSAGAKYYSDIIDELLKQGIEPEVTIYHFDLPIKLQDLGGWTNPLISDWFEDYARVVFSLYADRVKTWITINEPIVICDLAYNTATWAPGIKEMVLAPYICNKNTMLAHAKAYRLYERDYRQKYKGKISIANNVVWIDPDDSSKEAMELAELGLEHMVGRYSHPIFSKNGGWPSRIERQMHKYSSQEGHRKSILPSFTNEEKAFVRGTADFYALNYYTARVIRPAKEGETGLWFVSGSPELNVMMDLPPYSKPTVSPIMPTYPIGLRRMLSYLKKTYGNIEFLITENGYVSEREFSDYDRVHFIRDHLKQVLLSIKEDKVRVSGYTYWSLFDALEWDSGYSLLFGLYDLDYTDPARPRTARLSARYYACVIKSNSLNVSEKCTHNSGISELEYEIATNIGTKYIISHVILILSFILCF